MKTNQIVKTKEGMMPLYRKDDEFKIIRLNKEEGLIPIEARHLKSGRIYGFNEWEFKE